MFKVLQGAQAQALAGKIINTSQGQFIVGPNGQLLSKQKLLQNNVQANQTVRLDTIFIFFYVNMKKKNITKYFASGFP